MRYLDREVARAANKQARRINHFFGGHYSWSLICSEKYYWNSLKYVFRNPVRAGICQAVQNYPFSSLQDDRFDLKDLFAPDARHIELDLDWLNEPFLSEQEEAIRYGIRNEGNSELATRKKVEPSSESRPMCNTKR